LYKKNIYIQIQILQDVIINHSLYRAVFLDVQKMVFSKCFMNNLQENCFPTAITVIFLGSLPVKILECTINIIYNIIY